MVEEKKKVYATNLGKLYDSLEKDYGKGTIVQGDSIKQEFMSTGRIMLDRAIGGNNPGIPNNKIIEIYGPNAGGKTCVTLSMIAEAQKQGGTALFIDLEHTFNPDMARKLEVVLGDNACRVAHVPSGNIAFQIMDAVLENKIETGVGPDIIVVDSVSSIVPDRVLGRTIGDDDIGSIAKLMSNALPQLVDKVYRAEVPIIFINQTRQKKTANPKANPETTSGGMSLGFYASLRMRVSKIGDYIKDGNDVLGHRVMVAIKKNKVGIPFKCASFNLYYNSGVNKYAEIAEAAIDQGLIKKAGSWYSYVKLDETTGELTEVFKVQGVLNISDLLRVKNDVYQELLDSLEVEVVIEEKAPESQKEAV